MNCWFLISISNLLNAQVEPFEVNGDCLIAGHPDEHQAPEGHLNGQGAGATTARKNATAQALIENWKGSVTDRGRRGRAGIGTGASEGTGKDSRSGKDGPAAQTGTKTDENVEEVAAAAENGGVNAETKKGTVGMTGAGERTEITTKIEVLKGRGPGTRRAGERMMTGGIKMTESGTEKSARPKGRAEVEAGRGGIKVGEKKRAGKESAAIAERETGTETGSSVLTSVAAVKKGVIISASLATTIVSIVNAEGVRALSKCSNITCSAVVFFFLFLPSCSVTCAVRRRNISTSDIWSCLRPMLLYICFSAFSLPIRQLLDFIYNLESDKNGILIFLWFCLFCPWKICLYIMF